MTDTLDLNGNRTLPVPESIELETVARARAGRWSIDQLVRAYILEVVASVNGHRGHAAAILGIDRRTLYRKLKEYHVVMSDAEASEL